MKENSAEKEIPCFSCKVLECEASTDKLLYITKRKLWPDKCWHLNLLIIRCLWTFLLMSRLKKNSFLFSDGITSSRHVWLSWIGLLWDTLVVILGQIVLLMYLKVWGSCLVFLPTTLPTLLLNHPRSHRPPRLRRAPVCSRQLWVGGSWLSLEHSRREVTPLIPWG